MIAVEQEGGLVTLCLNRPDKANSLTAAMLEDLIAAVGRASDSGARALVLTGTDKVFSAGADLEEARAGLAISPLWDRLSGAIAGFDGLTVAALNGTLAGGAMGMALACDLRLAVPGAKFFYPVMRLGYLPQAADVPRLVALVGRSRAAMILMGGARIEAAEALAWGLVDRVVPPEGLMAEARALAADALAARPGHGAAIKAMIGRA
ncbi:MAG: enoyl-CoA hydratase/isomerase family protein [Pseudorhodobacter sp.]